MYICLNGMLDQGLVQYFCTLHLFDAVIQMPYSVDDTYAPSHDMSKLFTCI